MLNLVNSPDGNSRNLTSHYGPGRVELVLDHEFEGGVANALQLLISLIAIQIEGYESAPCLVSMWKAQKLPAMQGVVACMIQNAL